MSRSAPECLADDSDRGADRPAMLDMLSSLECALQLQNDVVQRDPEHGQTNNISNEMDITLIERSISINVYSRMDRKKVCYILL
jgi:hypothetical protein